VLTLGCHVGLEDRILRDLGAGRVLGVEVDPRLVAVSRALGIVGEEEIVAAEMGAFLRQDERRWQRILVLAPQELDLSALAALALARLAPGGRLVVLAHHGALRAIPPGLEGRSALEGTMLAYVLPEGGRP
jgi:predicted TPR repeat methyltransferase